MTRYSGPAEEVFPHDTTATPDPYAGDAGSTRDANGKSPMTRRALVALGSVLAGTGLWPLAAEAKKRKKKKKKKKKKKPQGQTVTLQALNMTGANEVSPTIGDDMGAGTATFEVNPNGTVCATFTFQTTTPNSTITGSHIHKGASTVNGPIVIDFHGNLSECVTVTDEALLEDLKANPGGYYANIHTNNFLNGAVREQLEIKA